MGRKIGHSVSLETRKKISEAHKGRKPWNKGIPCKQETKEKLRRANLGKTYTDEYKRKQSESHKGEKHWNWKGGITKINYKIRRSLEYRLWRDAVYKRDKYTCIWCGDNTSGNLEADHIKPFSTYPALRFAIDNGRTLCKKCHRKTETYGYKYKNITP